MAKGSPPRLGREPLPGEGSPHEAVPGWWAEVSSSSLVGGGWRAVSEGSAPPYQMKLAAVALSLHPQSYSPAFRPHFLCAESQALGTKGRLLSPRPLTPGGHASSSHFCPELQVTESPEGRGHSQPLPLQPISKGGLCPGQRSKVLQGSDFSLQASQPLTPHTPHPSPPS